MQHATTHLLEKLQFYLVILIGNHHQEQMKTIGEWIVYPKNSWQFLGSRNDETLQIIFMYPLRVKYDMECGATDNKSAIPYNTLLKQGELFFYNYIK